MKTAIHTTLLSTLLLTVTLPASASLIVTYAENPDATVSSLGNTNVFTFDNLTTGNSRGVTWSGVGSFDNLYVKGTDIYGGAVDAGNPKGSNYSLQGAGTGVLNSWLNLNHDSSYFGMWWSAGDASNTLKFYEGATLVGSFTTGSLMSKLPDSYFGNPKDRSMDRGEPFGFINFFGDPDTKWDKVLLSNNNSSGFESDNYTTRTTAWNPMVDGVLPGLPVALVNGSKTSSVTKASLAGTRWSQGASTHVGSAPGAPAPPAALLAAFAGVIGLRQIRQRRLPTA